MAKKDKKERKAAKVEREASLEKSWSSVVGGLKNLPTLGDKAIDALDEIDTGVGKKTKIKTLFLSVLKIEEKDWWENVVKLFAWANKKKDRAELMRSVVNNYKELAAKVV